MLQDAVEIQDSSPRWTLARLAPWLVLAAILLCAAAVRIRLLDLALERDEGEYALSGQLMLHGIPPYQQAWNMKFPGTYAAYALIMLVFGQTARGIHLGLLFLNAATTALVFLFARRLCDVRAALAAAAAFALLSLGVNVLGPMAHATHFVIFFALMGLLALHRAHENGALTGFFLSGMCSGTAVLMKQHGVFFGIFAGLWILLSALGSGDRPIRLLLRRLPLFTLGAFLPLALTCLTMWLFGAFTNFWFWTFQYAREYMGETSLADGWDNFRDELSHVASPNAAIWLLAAAGLALLWLRRDKLRLALPATTFLAFSLLAIAPGLYFRDHYFIMMLPVVALLAGAAVNEGLVRLRGPAALWLCGLAIALSVYQQRDFLFRMTLVEISRAAYGASPFPEAIPVANYIRSHTAPGSRIGILGSEPEICFLADRPPATGYIYTYALMESQPFAAPMQDEMIRQLEEAKPEYMVMVAVTSSWDLDEDSLMRIFDWWKRYQSLYDRVGVIDIFSKTRTDYRWDADAAAHPPEAVWNLVVFKRKKPSA